MNRNTKNHAASKAASDAANNDTSIKSVINHRIIGQRIREEREKLALTRAEFAEIIELSDYYIGQLERGERQMSLSVMLKIAACLHISLDYLVLGSTRYGNSEEGGMAPAFAYENGQSAEIKQLLERCSEKELELLKKLIQTVIPYIRQNTN